MRNRNVFQGVGMLLCILAGVISSMFLGLTAQAATETNGAASTNLHKHEYTWYYMEAPKSFLYVEDQAIVRVEAIGSKVVIEKYSSQYELVSTKEIAYELPIFGGFYHGANYNFLVFGQNNPNDSDSVEIMRVVKYDANWDKLGSVSYYGCNTYVPFDAGSMSIAEYGDMLYIRTCHEMYLSNDGYHHQACMTFSLKQSDLSKVDQYCSVMNVSIGYVSHSFNQFIKVVGNKVVAVDHGDAYPRSVVLGQYSKDASLGNVSTYGGYANVNLLTIPGSIGANYTGVNVGGFEVSATHYLVAINSVDLTQLGTGMVKNVKLLVQPVGNFGSEDTVIRDVTSYAETGDTSVSNPYLVPMEDDTFALIWEETKRPAGKYSAGSYYNRVMIQTVDQEGKPVGDVKQVEGALSDCAPIYVGGKLIWYVTKGGAPVFHDVPMTEESNRPTLTFKHNCEFDNNIAMHYVIPKSELEGCTNVRLVVDMEKYEKGETTPTWKQYVVSSYSDYKISDADYYHFTFPGIGAAEMGNVLKAKIVFEKGGETVESKEDVFSIKDYAYNRLECSDSATFKTLMVDMLNYGAAAQAHFNRNAAHPVNEQLTDEQLALGSQNQITVNETENTIENKGATAQFNGKNLVFDTNVVMRYRFAFADGQIFDNVKIRFTYVNGKNVVKKQEVPFSRFGKDENYYVADCSIITPSEMKCVVSATIYDGTTPISDTLEYSIEGYVYNRLQESDSKTFKYLLIKMLEYGTSVMKHFK